MTRKTAREISFHFLFELCFQAEMQPNFFDLRLSEETFAAMVNEYEPYGQTLNQKDKEYIQTVVTGVQENIAALDAKIVHYAENWSAKRISNVCFSILRLALFEIESLDDVPESAAINEAVTLAKLYESDEAGAFVNGILGAISRGIKE